MHKCQGLVIHLNRCRYFYSVYLLILQESFYGVTVNGVNVPTGKRYSPHDRVDDFLYSGYQYDLNGGRTDSFSRRQANLHMIMLDSYYNIVSTMKEIEQQYSFFTQR